MVTIVDDPSGIPNAGAEYTLVCTVEVVVGLSVVPEVTWTDPNSTMVVSGGGINVTGPTTVGNITTISLTFLSIYTSHRGEFTCTANITIPSVSISNVIGSSTFKVIVQGKYNRKLVLIALYVVPYSAMMHRL